MKRTADTPFYDELNCLKSSSDRNWASWTCFGKTWTFSTIDVIVPIEHFRHASHIRKAQFLSNELVKKSRDRQKNRWHSSACFKNAKTNWDETVRRAITVRTLLYSFVFPCTPLYSFVLPCTPTYSSVRPGSPWYFLVLLGTTCYSFGLLGNPVLQSKEVRCFSLAFWPQEVHKVNLIAFE